MSESRNKAIFLDRDGVINEERGTYTFLPEDFNLIDGVPEAIRLLNHHGFTIIVITNQSGISQGLYTVEMMRSCHDKMRKACDFLIDDIFYARWHPSVSQSLSRKPERLMFERAIARYNIDPKHSWMIGDKERDIEPAIKVHLNSILIHHKDTKTKADYIFNNLLEATKMILALNHPQ